MLRTYWMHVVVLVLLFGMYKTFWLLSFGQIFVRGGELSYMLHQYMRREKDQNHKHWSAFFRKHVGEQSSQDMEMILFKN